MFPPVRSVGDGRRYDYMVSLRAMQAVDFMAAHWVPPPYALLVCQKPPISLSGKAKLSR